jgi:hypothetical protein
LFAGRLATQLTLKGFDKEDQSLITDNQKYTSRGQEKKYQPRYGEVEVSRHVYQRSCGGMIWVPMEVKAQLFRGSYTPKFGKIISWKYA